jgi:hypothetical protein
MIKSPEHGMNPEMIFRNARREERRAPHHVVRARAIFEEKRGKAQNMCSGFVAFSKKRSKAKQSKAGQSKAQNMGSEGFIFGECTNVQVRDEEDKEWDRAKYLYTSETR